MTGEIWLEIKGFPEYQVSSKGNVRRKKSGRLLKATPGGTGYRSVKLCVGERRLDCRVNRLVLEAFVGPAPSGKHQAAHNDGNRLNNAVENLRWATPKENFSDRKKHGTWPCGENGPATLTEVQVIEILKSNLPNRTLARLCGVGEATITAIKKRQTWAHVNILGGTDEIHSDRVSCLGKTEDGQG